MRLRFFRPCRRAKRQTLRRRKPARLNRVIDRDPAAQLIFKLCVPRAMNQKIAEVEMQSARRVAFGQDQREGMFGVAGREALGSVCRGYANVEGKSGRRKRFSLFADAEFCCDMKILEPFIGASSASLILTR